MKILSCRIESDYGHATMHVTLEDGSEHKAFSWFVDELAFTPADAIGKTLAELRALYHERDVAYLRAP